MKKLTVLLLCICLLLFVFNIADTHAATKTETFELDGPSWNYGGPIPDTYYTPWLPFPSVFVRTRVGARFSSSVINLKCPMKVSIAYDESKALPGSRVPLEIKIEPNAPTSGYAFESAFGVYLPSDVQVGFVGFPGVPDSILPWTAIDYNLWDLLGFIPKVGQYIAAAKDQIGVNMRSGKDGDNNKLPLNASKEYHDTRVLIDVTDAALTDDVIQGAIIDKLYGKIPSSALTALKAIFTEKEIKDKIGKGIEKFAKVASLKIKGDPSYKVEGQSVELLLNYQVPGKTNGDMPFSLTSPTAKGTFNIHIPYFSNSTDKLEMKVMSVGYHFTLYQTLKIQIGIPILGDIDIVNLTYTVTQKTISCDVPDDKGKLSIPIQEGAELAGDFHVGLGAVTATAFCGSRNTLMKCSARVTGQGFDRTFEEPDYRLAHAVAISGLTPEKDYNVVMTLTDQSNQITISSPSIAFKTKSAKVCDGVGEETVDSGLSLDSETITPGKTQIDFTWRTSEKASTEVFISQEPDVRTNYISYVKKTGGVTAGYYDSVPGERVRETNHTITATNLASDTVYYYIIRSYAFKDDDPVKYPGDFRRVGLMGQIRTLPPYIPVTVVVKAQSATMLLTPIQITVTKQGSTTPILNIGAYSTGLTPLIPLNRGTSYVFSVKDDPYFEDVSSSPVSVSSTAEGALPVVTLNLTKRTSPGGFIYDSKGDPIEGASVRLKTQVSDITVTTDKSGHFTSETLNGGTGVAVNASKDDYIGAGTVGYIDPYYHIFRSPNLILNNGIGNATITVKKNATAYANAPIEIRLAQGAQTLVTTLTANSSGKATFTRTYQYDNQSDALIAKVVPPADSKIFPQTAPFSLAPGESTNVLMVCETDEVAPTISDIVFNSDDQGLLLSFKSSEPSKYTVEAKNPQGQLVQTYPAYGQWAYMVGAGGNEINNFKIPTNMTGTHKIKIKVKDWKENMTETPYQDAVWNGPLPPFGFTIKSREYTAVTFTWRRPFENASEFGKYVLTIDNPSKTYEITDRSVTEQKVTGLAEGSVCFGTFKIYSKTGTVLYAPDCSGGSGGGTPGRFSVQLPTPPPDPATLPQLTSFTLTPTSVAEGGDINLKATYRFPQSVTNSIKVTAHGFEQKGTYLSHDEVYANTFSGEVDKTLLNSLNINFSLDTAKQYDIELVITSAADETLSDVRYVLVTKPESSEEGKSEEGKSEEGESGEDVGADVAVTKVSSSTTLTAGKESYINVYAKNMINKELDNCVVTASTSEGFQADQTISLGKKGSKTVKFDWKPGKSGTVTLNGTIFHSEDKNDKNNSVSADVTVK
jgi:hypothetical protein